MERRRDRSRSRDREREKDRNRTSRDDRGPRRKRSRSLSRDALMDGKRSRRSRSRSRDKQDYRGTRDSRDDRGRKDNGRDDRDVDRSRKDSGREERDADRSRKDSGRDSRSDRGGKPREDKNLDGIKAEEVVLPPKQEEESYVPRPKVEVSCRSIPSTHGFVLRENKLSNSSAKMLFLPLFLLAQEQLNCTVCVCLLQPLSLEEILNKRQQAKELDAKVFPHTAHVPLPPIGF